MAFTFRSSSFLYASASCLWGASGKKKENEKNGAPKAQSGGLEAVAVAKFMQLQNHLLYFVQGTLFTNFSCTTAFKAS